MSKTPHKSSVILVLLRHVSLNASSRRNANTFIRVIARRNVPDKVFPNSPSSSMLLSPSCSFSRPSNLICANELAHYFELISSSTLPSPFPCSTRQVRVRSRGEHIFTPRSSLPGWICHLRHQCTYSPLLSIILTLLAWKHHRRHSNCRRSCSCCWEKNCFSLALSNICWKGDGNRFSYWLCHVRPHCRRPYPRKSRSCRCSELPLQLRRTNAYWILYAGSQWSCSSFWWR